MILAVMPFGVMAFFFLNADNFMQLIELTPLGWIILSGIILGVVYMIIKRRRKEK